MRTACAFVTVVALCSAGGPVLAQERGTPRDLETLERTLQQVVEQNLMLAKRVQTLEEEVRTLQGSGDGDRPLEGASVSEAPTPDEGRAADDLQQGEETEEDELALESTLEEDEEAEAPEAASSEAEGFLAVPSDVEDATAFINRYVKLGGAIEVVTGWSDDFESNSSSDIQLESAEFDLEVIPHEWITGVIAVEYENEDDKLVVDEAFMTIGKPDAFYPFISAGRFFVPFGLSTGDNVSDTLSITDPLTFEVFETRQEAILLGIGDVGLFSTRGVFGSERNYFDSDGLTAGVYVFASDFVEAGATETSEDGEFDPGIEGDSSEISEFGASAAYFLENGFYDIAVGVDFTSSVFDSDGLRDEFSGKALDTSPGIAGHVRFRFHDFYGVAEINQAFETVGVIDDDEAVSVQPSAWQLGGAYQTQLFDRPTFFDVTYSATRRLEGVFPEQRFTVTAGRWQFEDLRLSVEYAHDRDYAEDDGGTGNSANAVTGQVTFEW